MSALGNVLLNLLYEGIKELAICSSAPSFPNEFTLVQRDLQYRPYDIKSCDGRPLAVVGEHFQRMLGRLSHRLCIGSHSTRTAYDEKHRQRLERTVSYLQTANRVLVSRIGSLTEKARGAAKRTQEDTETIKTLRRKVGRLSSENDHARNRCTETAHHLEGSSDFIDRLQLHIDMKDKEISDLKASNEEFARKTKEQLTLIEEMRQELIDLRSKKGFEVGEAEDREGSGQLQEVPKKHHRTRRGGVKHRRSKTSNSTRWLGVTPVDRQEITSNPGCLGGDVRLSAILQGVETTDSCAE